MQIARINDEVITAESWIKQLKLSDEFPALVEKVIEQKLAVHVAKKAGISVAVEEIQARIEIGVVQKTVDQMVDTKPKARELISLLEDDPEQFADYAREHSLDDDTRAQGGYIGRMQRGSLNPSIESKLFNADIGEPLGPFTNAAELVYEIYQVNARHPAQLDEDTQRKVAKTLYDEWLRARAEEHVLEIA